MTAFHRLRRLFTVEQAQALAAAGFDLWYVPAVTLLGAGAE